MAAEHAKGLIDRRFELVVIDAPTLFRSSAAESRAVCRRIERLLDTEVRVVLVAFDEAGVDPLDICQNVGGLSRAFLFAWTKDGELFGFNQWGLPVRLTKGKIENPEAAAAMILDVVAEPAEIRAGHVLVIGESFGPGGRDRAFTGKAYSGARLVALTESVELPEGVRRVPLRQDVVTAMLDTLLWIWS